VAVPTGAFFCKLSLQKLSARSPELVADELEAIARAGFENVELYDDTFTWQRERVLKICEEIISRQIKLGWSVRARVDKVDYEMLKK